MEQVEQAEADKFERSVRHYLDHSLEQFTNGGRYSTKTSGYLAAKVPDWQLLRWIEATQAKDEEIARYRAALEAILNEETVDVHVGYDSGSGGGNFVYADAVRTDSDAFRQARAILADKSRG